MRLPVVPPISTKDGLSNKNARLTNCLKESKKSGDMAVVRPGLSLDAVASGVGGGLVTFNNELVSVYGTTLGFGVGGDELADWTKINSVTPTGRAAVANNGSTFLQYQQSSIDGDTWVNLADPFVDDGYIIAIGSDFYGVLNALSGVGFLKKSTDNGASWSVIGDMPPNDPATWSLYYAGGVLYAYEDDMAELWSSVDLGLNWTQESPITPPMRGFPIMAGSDLYIFTDSAYCMSSNYVDFTAGSPLYDSTLSVGYYLDGYFYGYNQGTEQVFRSAIGDLGNAEILASVPKAYDPDAYFTYTGQPFRIGNSSYIFGLNGVYRSIGAITPLTTIATDNYDFAQSPL